MEPKIFFSKTSWHLCACFVTVYYFICQEIKKVTYCGDNQSHQSQHQLQPTTKHFTLHHFYIILLPLNIYIIIMLTHYVVECCSILFQLEYLINLLVLPKYSKIFYCYELSPVLQNSEEISVEDNGIVSHHLKIANQFI